jgi:hypothetical protein
MKQSLPITWNDIKNWWPIIGAMVGITFWLSSLIYTVKLDQADMKKDIGYLIERTDGVNTTVLDLQKEHQNFVTRLTTLEVLHR